MIIKKYKIILTKYPKAKRKVLNYYKMVWINFKKIFKMKYRKNYYNLDLNRHLIF